VRYPVSKPCIGPLERSLVDDCLIHVRLSQGEMVRRFEQTLAAYVGTRYAIATTSGTTALHLVLAALGVGPGDEVLVPDLSFVATANAVAYTGATPVLVDVDASSWCMDVNDARRKLTSRTRAILPVHLYGVAADMTRLRDLGVTIIEDAAEGLGGALHGRMLGAWGHAGTFSFYGNKVATCGEGGAITTDDEALYHRMHFLRGQALDPKRRYYHPEIGFNYRLTDLQAAVGVAQLMRLEEMLERRREIFDIYHTRLCDHIGVVPSVLRQSRPAPWVFTLQLNHGVSRDGMMARLADRGIETRPGFVPMHLLPMYRREGFPVATRLADSIISLPTYPALTDEDVHVICDEVCSAFEDQLCGLQP
jgi:perosamine synthetase